jgi:hypothetical protein
VVRTIRYLVVLAGGFVAGSQAVDATRRWQEWHAWNVRDASAAAEYRDFFLMNVASIVLSLAIAALVWRLLRPATDLGDESSLRR